MIRHPAHRSVLLEPNQIEKTRTTELTPWIHGRDLGIAGLVLLLGFASWFIPEKKWLSFVHKLVAKRLRRESNLDRQQLAIFQVIVGDRSSSWIKEHFRLAWLGHKYHSWMQLLACHRPKAWRPSPCLVGREHLDAALAQKSGVLLLTANFAYQDLMGKAALADAGYSLNHLARDTHGFFESRLGQRLLNPIYTLIEDRFLKERMIFSGNQTKDVNAKIRAKLKSNQLVSIKVTPLGRRVLTLPFLFGKITIATGALNFACEANAAVLPVFTIRKPDGTIETIIEPELNQPASSRRNETIEAMLQDYVPRLEMYVAQYPEQFSFPSSSDGGEMLIKPWEQPANFNQETVAVSRPRVAEPA